MEEFKRDTELERLMLQRLTDAVRLYLEIVEKPNGARHRHTVMLFVGDRYRPKSIDAKFTIPKTKEL